jgi:hypothetical protein
MIVRVCTKNYDTQVAPVTSLDVSNMVKGLTKYCDLRISGSDKEQSMQILDAFKPRFDVSLSRDAALTLRSVCACKNSALQLIFENIAAGR